MAMEETLDNASQAQRVCRAAFERWEGWSRGRAATVLSGCWAMAEATVWPILPDFVLIPLAVGNRRRIPAPLLSAIAGMTIGGTALYLFSTFQPEQARILLQQLPTVKASKAAEARSILVSHGVGAFLIQPWSGIPFKVWAIEAGALRISPPQAIPLFVVGRSLRMVLLTTVARVLARRFDRQLRDYSIAAALLYLALFFAGWYRLLQ